MESGKFVWDGREDGMAPRDYIPSDGEFCETVNDVIFPALAGASPYGLLEAVGVQRILLHLGLSRFDVQASMVYYDKVRAMRDPFRQPLSVVCDVALCEAKASFDSRAVKIVVMHHQAWVNW